MVYFCLKYVVLGLNKELIVCFHKNTTDKVFKDTDGEHCVSEGDTILDLRQLWRDTINNRTTSSHTANITTVTHSCHKPGPEPMPEGHIMMMIWREEGRILSTPILSNIGHISVFTCHSWGLNRPVVCICAYGVSGTPPKCQASLWTG